MLAKAGMQMDPVMRKPVAAATSLAWFATVGGTFGCLLPYLLNDWHFHQPLPDWQAARVLGAALIGAGLVPVVNSFADFFRPPGPPCLRRRRRSWWSAVSTDTSATPSTPAS